MKRYRVNRFRDMRRFKYGANRTASTNVSLSTFRGGIRL